MYHSIRFLLASDIAEIVSALLFPYFEGIEEDAGGFIGFLPKDQDLAPIQDHIHLLQQQFDFQYAVETIPDTNWNKAWESNFEPVEIADFCRIYADFHVPEVGFEHQIKIHPRMAFGTGHHETTYLMIQAMQHIEFGGRAVWDFGTGTGILAILAKKLGAGTTVIANDNDPLAVVNAIENADNNQVTGIDFRLGGIDIVTERAFDVVLANINRRVILESIESLSTQIKERGTILLSGILTEDYPLVIEKCQNNHLVEHLYLEQNNWICLLLQRA